MTAHYHPTLVLISILIAVLASHTALDLTYSLTITRGRARAAWLAAGAFAMGSGIWSMHFTGMLAFRLPGTPIAYEINRLIASIVIAIGASALALFVFTRPHIRTGALILSGLAMGVAISGMHYMGMAGFRAPVSIKWNGLIVALSILIAVGASFVALNIAARIRSATRHPIMLKIAGGVIMGLAIAGMHYTGMAAAHFDPAALAPSAEAKVLATRALAIAVTAASMVILLVSSGASLATRNMARHRYYRALIENASDLIAVVDETGIRKYVSPSYQRVLGYDPDELLGKNAWDFLNPDDGPEARRVFGELLGEKGSQREAVVRVRHANMSWRTLHVLGQNLLDDPFVRGIVMTAQDETDRRRLEIQIGQSQKMEAVGKLAGGIAHDFNNLLTVIIGNTNLLRISEQLDDELLNEVEGAAERAASLTRQLLAFSRRQVMQPRSIDLNEIVRGMNQMVSRLLGDDVVVQLRLDESIPSIRADAGQIEQAFMNLAVNARDAMPDGGLLTVETMCISSAQQMHSQHDNVPPGKYVCLDVTDSGRGIAPEVLPRIFEPFFTTKEVGKGTGLGLAGVYGIVKQSGGYVWVMSAPERGATFRLLFPPVAANEKVHSAATTDTSTSYLS